MLVIVRRSIKGQKLDSPDTWHLKALEEGSAWVNWQGAESIPCHTLYLNK
jgi:hypothetical protein